MGKEYDFKKKIYKIVVHLYTDNRNPKSLNLKRYRIC